MRTAPGTILTRISFGERLICWECRLDGVWSFVKRYRWTGRTLRPVGSCRNVDAVLHRLKGVRQLNPSGSEPDETRRHRRSQKRSRMTVVSAFGNAPQPLRIEQNG